MAGQQQNQDERSDASRNQAPDPAREGGAIRPQGQAEPDDPAEVRKRDGIDPARESAGVEPT